MVVSPGHFGYLLVGRIGRGLVDAAGGSGRGRVSPSRCNAGGGVGRVHSTMYAPMRDEGGLACVTVVSVSVGTVLSGRTVSVP